MLLRVIGLGSILASTAIACGSDDSGNSKPQTGGNGGTGASGASGGSGGAMSGGAGGHDASADAPLESSSDAGTGCHAAPGPADAVRRVVVSLPYDAASKPAPAFGVLELDTSGKLTPTTTRFDLERASSGRIVFSPDGALGFVATEKGNIGVFRLDSSNATVVHAAYDGSFYASHLLVDPSGERLWVLDDEWADIGGGFYSLRIACDGSLSDEKKVLGAKLPAALAFVSPGSVLAAAQELPATPAGSDFHLIDLTAPSVLGSTTAFVGGDAGVSALALSHDGKYALVGDNNAYGSQPNRVAVVAIDGTSLSLVQTLSPIEDPYDIAASPHDHSALVVSGFGDALIVLKPGSTTPYQIAGPLAYVGGKPQVPGNLAEVRRGNLSGRVLVAEVTGIRQVELAPGSSVTDLGVTSLPGSGVEAMVGAIGIQP